MNPRVTIVVAVKNAGFELRRFVKEFLDHRPHETALVVVDGGSTDGTPEWLETVAPGGEADEFQWISQPDTGIAQAWSRGVGIADGDWIVFLGCDDRVGDPAAWGRVLRTLGHLPEDCDVAAFPVDIVSPGGSMIGTALPRTGDPLLAVNTIPHQGCFHRRGLWARLGPFDESFPVACDYEFLLRASLAGVGLRAFDDATPVRMRFGGASKRDPLRNLREFRAAQIKHGVRRFRLAWWAAWTRAAVRCCVRPLLGEENTAWMADVVRRLRGLPRAWTAK